MKKVDIIELIRLQDDFFVLRNKRDKVDLLNKINDLKLKVVHELFKDNEEQFYNYYNANDYNRCFVWELNFPKVFRNSGFDIVIGNPPYISIKNSSYDMNDLLKMHWETAWKRFDISIVFFELGFKLFSDNGFVCYIASSQFLTAEFGRKMREYLVNKHAVHKIIDFGDLPVFGDATTYVSVFFITNKYSENFQFAKVDSLPFLEPSLFSKFLIEKMSDEVWILGECNNF